MYIEDAQEIWEWENGLWESKGSRNSPFPLPSEAILACVYFRQQTVKKPGQWLMTKWSSYIPGLGTLLPSNQIWLSLFVWCNGFIFVMGCKRMGHMWPCKAWNILSGLLGGKVCEPQFQSMNYKINNRKPETWPLSRRWKEAWLKKRHVTSKHSCSGGIEENFLDF